MRVSIALLPALITAPVFADPPRVVADIAPVHALLAQVMEGVAVPDLLLGQTANPHSVQLKPSQVRMLAGADLLVWVGPDLSPWLDRVADSGAADQLVLMAQEATRLRDFGAAGGDDGHDHGGAAQDDHAGEAHTGEGAQGQVEDGREDHPKSMPEGETPAGHHDHDHSGADPHVWLSMDNARAWLTLFADTLALRDPDNAAAYRANAAAADDGLAALDAQITDRLEAYHGAEIVTFHDSLGYFADEYGLEIVGSVRPGDGAAPSAAAMSDLRELVSDHAVACAFAEPAFDPGLLEAIAEGTGLRIGMIDPTGALLPPGPDHYTATMTAIADGIAECLEGE